MRKTSKIVFVPKYKSSVVLAKPNINMLPYLDRLTDRELEILRLYATGDTSHEVAVQLGLSYHTVESYKQKMMLKSQAKNMAQLAIANLKIEQSKTPLKPNDMQMTTSSTTNILTSRETQILSELCNGYSAKEIAERLSVSAHTVNTHKQNLFVKVQARNTVHLASIALKNGWIEL